jgi:hypothetical protein
LEQQEPPIQPAVEGIPLQIAGESGHMLQRRNLVQHPLAVRPPQAAGRIVVVVGLVGELVVMAMQPHPFDGPALAGQCAHEHQQPLKPFRGNEAAVGDQPV